MATCSSCGATIDDNAQFCPQCGAAQPGQSGVNGITGNHFKTMGKTPIMGGMPSVEIANDNGVIGSVSFSGGVRGMFEEDFQLNDPSGNVLVMTRHNRPKKLISAFRNYSILDPSGNEIGQMDIHTRKAVLRTSSGQEYEVTESLGGSDMKIRANGQDVAEIKHHIASRYFEGTITGDIPAPVFVTYLLFKTLQHAVSSGEFLGPGFQNGGFRI